MFKCLNNLFTYSFNVVLNRELHDYNTKTKDNVPKAFSIRNWGLCSGGSRRGTEGPKKSFFGDRDSVFREYNFSLTPDFDPQAKISENPESASPSPSALSSIDHSWNLSLCALTFSSRVLNALFMGKSVSKRCGSKSSWVFGNCGNRLSASAMFFVLPFSSEVLSGKQQKQLGFFGGGQIRVPLLQTNSLTRNKRVYKLLKFGWC